MLVHTFWVTSTGTVADLRINLCSDGARIADHPVDGSYIFDGIEFQR